MLKVKKMRTVSAHLLAYLFLDLVHYVIQISTPPAHAAHPGGRGGWWCGGWLDEYEVGELFKV